MCCEREKACGDRDAGPFQCRNTGAGCGDGRIRRIGPDTGVHPPKTADPGADWTKRIEEILESLYRPEARDYRERGGAAAGLIDWRGIDTPNYHCRPPSPATGSMGGTVQLVSAPGYFLLLNEGGSYFRIIPIVDENRVEESAYVGHPRRARRQREDRELGL